MRSHSAVVVGAGPTGLMLAGELALAGVDAAIVERRPDQQLAGSRAGGLQSRTIEIFDQRGIADRFLAEGQPAQVIGFAWTRLDMSDFPSRYPYGLGLWQNHIERILAGWVAELKVPIYHGLEVTGLEQDQSEVRAHLSDGSVMAAEYLIGCDGGRSRVRKAAGIDFPGWDATTSSIIAEVEMTEPPDIGIRHRAAGVYGLSRVEYEIVDGQVVFKDTGPVRVMITEAEPGAEAEPTLEDIRSMLVELYGRDFGVHSPIWISRFTDMSRQAASYRDRRVLLAGDAAHIHSPVGGQGLNTGVQDAVNLGWKLAQVIKGVSPETLLDSYHAERHPVGARVLKITMAQVAALRPDERSTALRDVLAELVVLDEPRKRLVAELSGLGVRYDLGQGHPLLGRRMPDLDLECDGGPTRFYTLLHQGRAVLLRLQGGEERDVAGWQDRVHVVDARYAGPWELPAMGEVVAPSAVLVRPDGYVAWVGAGDEQLGLADALTRWFGEPAAELRS